MVFKGEVYLLVMIIGDLVNFFLGFCLFENDVDVYFKDVFDNLVY